MTSPLVKPETAKSAAQPVTVVQPIAAVGPAAPIAPVREIIPPQQRAVPAPPPPRPSIAPAVTVPPAAAPRERPVIPVREVLPEPATLRDTQTLRETRPPYKLLAFAAVVLAVVAAALWLSVSLSKASRNHSAEASALLTQASRLITQADADAAQFQQTDLTPEQVATSLQTRAAQYQEAQRLCQAAFPLGADRSMLSRDRQAAVRGLHQAQADTEAQSARLLTAEIGASIALYKHQTLTDTQAAQIRAKLRADCEAALGHCAAALDADPANAVAWAARVRALRFLGEPKAADAALARALALSPGSPVLLALGGTPK